jgi:sugar phosphate isomerase/epimerase
MQMSITDSLSRRAFVAGSLVTPFLAFAKNHIPVGLELYSVRKELASDPMNTLETVAKMGYQCVEFYAPYYDWSPEHAKEVRAHLDRLKLRCHSTHNSLHALNPKGLDKAIELNKILGSSYIVCAHPGNVKTVDDWRTVAAILNDADRHMSSSKLHAGYHNHDLEWKPVDGQVPMELIASSTDKSIMLQLDVGTCLEAGRDPVAWIKSNPGRVRSMHLKDWSPDKGYQVLFGEGVAPWKDIFATEKIGGVEFYLIEQEGSRFDENETASRCLKAYDELRHAAQAQLNLSGTPLRAEPSPDPPLHRADL